MNRALAALYAHRAKTGQEIRYSFGGKGQTMNEPPDILSADDFLHTRAAEAGIHYDLPTDEPSQPTPPVPQPPDERKESCD